MADENTYGEVVGYVLCPNCIVHHCTMDVQ